MFQTSYSPFEGLSKVFLVLIAIGILAALAFTNSDLTNFITNSAKAEDIKREITLQSRKDAIDIENYRTVEDAKEKAQLDRIEADKIADEKLRIQRLQEQAQQAALDLEMSRLFNYVKTSAIMILAICFGILLIQFGRSRLILAQAQLKQIDNWQNPALRKMQIELARQREQMERVSFMRQTQATADSTSYKGQEVPIPWEDLRQQFVDK